MVRFIDIQCAYAHVLPQVVRVGTGMPLFAHANTIPLPKPVPFPKFLSAVEARPQPQKDEEAEPKIHWLGDGFSFRVLDFVF